MQNLGARLGEPPGELRFLAGLEDRLPQPSSRPIQPPPGAVLGDPASLIGIGAGVAPVLEQGSRTEFQRIRRCYQDRQCPIISMF
ncbi:hypothetical protein RPD_1582 [Rhodopseudomonas palustris BisB5]|uniref:Uncharacterized protein n=1 Tax=Rhodopseudomonas palustris (strain BisB5) TaxID=316057 RepID=Q13AS0_RHOPS|nr:hypothetical protein RPD_1582 [Rhodopseudomonas palustris BisB5]